MKSSYRRVDGVLRRVDGVEVVDAENPGRLGPERLASEPFPQMLVSYLYH